MFEHLVPFVAAPKLQASASAETKKPLSKNFKIRSLGLGFYHGHSMFSSRANIKGARFEKSPYDFETIIKAVDTDSYVKQAFWKYSDLFWKEGWDITGENAEAVNYLYQRLERFEEAMQEPINEFFVKVVDELCKFGNAFIVKCYGSIDPYYRVAGDPNKSLIGLDIIPAQTVRIERDKHNRPLRYQQSITAMDTGWDNTATEPTWPAEEVIHLSLDKKEGYAFGTPFVISALDDVIALRQVEQDWQNLVHRDLFPLYKYIVGTETSPASEEELAAAGRTLEDLRVEGGLILPERHNVEVIGAEGSALDITNPIKHFKERVAVGLGIYPHHLGMETEGTNRSATDRLDVSLYDKIKRLQKYVAGVLALKLFKPLLREGGFQPIITPKAAGVSDYCYMRFREIDIDTQIKKQNHYVNMFANNAIDFNELRDLLGMSREADFNLLFMVMQTQIQTAGQMEVAKLTAALAPPPAAASSSSSSGGKAPAPKKPKAIPSSTGGVPNLPNPTRGTGNQVTPANQHGQRTSPNVRHRNYEPIITESLLDDMVDLLDDDYDTGVINE